MTATFRGPSARGFDWEHILENHSDNGRVARQSGKKTLFIGLTDAQIRARVMAAWRKRQRIRSQFDPLGAERIVYRGTANRNREVIEFWYNVQTKIVETAYPLP